MKREILFMGAALAAVLGGGAAAARPPAAGPEKTRVVRVLILADISFKRDARWKVEVQRAFMDANSSFRPAVGIRLEAAGFDYWDPAVDPLPARSPIRPGRTSLRTLIARLGRYKERSVAGPSGIDPPPEILAAIVPAGPDGLVDPGIADYLHGLIVIKRLPPPASVSHALLHELCHLYGAVDLSEKGSVMSLTRPTFGLDRFTRDIMRINRDRSFRLGDFPLDEDRIVQAIRLYERRRERRLGERELEICLRALKVELAVHRRAESDSGFRPLPFEAGRPAMSRVKH